MSDDCCRPTYTPPQIYSTKDRTKTMGEEAPTHPSPRPTSEPTSESADDGAPTAAEAAAEAAASDPELDGARKDMAGLLTAANVTRVIFVDDANSPGGESIDEVVQALEAGTLRVEDLAVVPSVRGYLSEDGELADNQRAAALLSRDDLDLDIAGAAIEALADSGTSERQPDETAIRIVQDLLPPEGVRYSAETLETWPDVLAGLVDPHPPADAASDDVEADTDRAATLVLIDRDFSKEPGGRADQGEAMVADLVRRAGNRAGIYVALVTHKFTPDEEEQRQATISEEIGIEEGFVIVSKLRLTDDMSGFVRRLGFIVAWTAARNLTSLVLSAVKTVYEEAADHVGDIPPSELCRVLVHETKADGVWETDQLLRLLRARIEANLILQLRTNPDAWILSDRLRRVSPEVNVPADDFHSSKVRRLQRDEIYLPADVLNLGIGIDTGDIFRVVKLGSAPGMWTGVRRNEEYLIVLEQNCNVAIRDGGRREPEIAIAVGKIDKWNPIAPNGSRRQAGVSQFHLPMFSPDNGEDAVVWLNRRKTIPWQALDATVWGPEAQADTPLDKHAPLDVRLDDRWQQRYHLAVDRANKLRNQVTGLFDWAKLMPEAKTLLLRGILGGSYNFPAELNDTHLRFGLQRIARLREPYATMLRSKSGAYQARQALEAPLMSAPDADASETLTECESMCECAEDIDGATESHDTQVEASHDTDAGPPSGGALSEGIEHGAGAGDGAAASGSADPKPGVDPT